jgi:hypothetical protein
MLLKMRPRRVTPEENAASDRLRARLRTIGGIAERRRASPGAV